MTNKEATPIIIAIIAWMAVVTTWGCCKNPEPGAPNPVIVRQPDNTLPLPSCRVVYIGVCPYTWCVYGIHANNAVAGLVPMRYNCDPGSAVLSTHKPTNSEWEPKP